MKVLLVIPNRPSKQILPQEDIGLAYIASAAGKVADSVDVLDCHLEGFSDEDFASYLKGKKYDLIGLRCLAMDHPVLGRYCKIIHRILPGAVTVAGGPHPSAIPEYLLGSFPELDYCVCGEGELPLAGLLNLLKEYGENIPVEELKKIPGLAFRNQAAGAIFHPAPNFTENLDALAFPAWELFKLRNYPAMPGQGRSLPMITTRGCSGQCTFCCNDAVFGRQIRFRSIENISAEIELLTVQYRARHINIFDNNFASRMGFLEEFSFQKEKRWPKLSYSIPQGIRIELINEKMIRLLDQSGCRMIGIGIESGDTDTLLRVKKGIDLEMVREKLGILRKHSRMQVIGFFVLGFPHEGEREIKKTIEYALSLPLDFAAFTIFTPFSGTQIFRELVEKRELDLDGLDWTQMQLDRQIFKRKGISEKKLKQLQRQAYFRFYCRYPQALKLAADIFKKGGWLAYAKRITSILQK